ncbi:glucose-1-phosphate thymidylyltransferase RfbA [Chelatococcus sambhunathii]|uniref:Glucose-1-phosphate thymidylyltransferase n=1 Tax=Chelatococcus sambhunathii TaxID=363953 RepID=A0ABU1DBD8_9HYPH|nr:glucose-1-phosphate thymidylyltransferase RfbA [Chelatococcus sambhunathii]MDR4305427.1 glucose-1-phosphate thymidylyltransferase RfbA [Chelatococcus sambhunathii]
MKGIVLAGGSGTRLYPATLAVNKQLLPVYDKPMIYYPLSALMLAGIRDILLIASPEFLDSYRRLLGDGSDHGLSLSYAIQEKPEGIAQALVIGREFVGDGRVALVLGDNIFFSANLGERLKAVASREAGATIFAYQVEDPQRYGVVELDAAGRPTAIVEKPEKPRSDWAVTGLYFYDNAVLDIAAALKPSTRGEFEITDVNRAYLERGELSVEKLGRGAAWLDTGTHDSLLEASEFVRALQHRQGLAIACLEEIAFENGFIDLAALEARGRLFEKTAYGRYLLRLVDAQRAT